MRLLVLVLAAAMAPAPHPVEYWRAIAANHYDVPAGTTARDLTPELVDDLGSPNPELRDDIAYSTLTAWIYQKKLLQPAELIDIARTLEANLSNDAFHAWLTSAAAGATFPTTVSVASLRAAQNTRHLLTALSTELSADERPSDGADFARAALETTLKTLF